MLMECAREKGVSSWVSTLPFEEHGFFLHKGAFRDALCLRYGWKIHNLPIQCACGDPLSVDLKQQHLHDHAHLQAYALKARFISIGLQKAG